MDEAGRGPEPSGKATGDDKSPTQVDPVLSPRCRGTTVQRPRYPSIFLSPWPYYLTCQEISFPTESTYIKDRGVATPQMATQWQSPTQVSLHFPDKGEDLPCLGAHAQGEESHPSQSFPPLLTKSLWCLFVVWFETRPPLPT